MNGCPECGSTHVVRAGLKITRQGKKQRWQCANCGRTFYEIKEEEATI